MCLNLNEATIGRTSLSVLPTEDGTVKAANHKRAIITSVHLLWTPFHLLQNLLASVVAAAAERPETHTKQSALELWPGTAWLN